MPEGKQFFIVSKLNGLVLDIEGESTNPGTRVVTWERKDGRPANQLWTQDYGRHCIRSVLDPALCLTVNESNTLVVDTHDDDKDQCWCVHGDKIQNRDGDKVLDVKAAESAPLAEVCAWQLHGNDNQLWSFDYVEASLFRIVSKMHGKVMTSMKDKKVKMYGAEGDMAEQLWYEDKHGAIACSANSKCLNGAKGCGEKVVLTLWEEADDASDVQWEIDGDAICSRKDPNLVLDIKGESEDDGAKVIIWEKNDQSNQKWEIQYV